MGEILVVRDPHNLSHSRVKSFFGCAARMGYEGLYEGYKSEAAPYWLAGGSAVHHVIDDLLKKTVVCGQTLPEEEVDTEVDKARKFIWAVLNGKCSPKGYGYAPKQGVYWMSAEERERHSAKDLEKKIREKINRYINEATPGIRAIALQCVEKSPFARTFTEVKFDNVLSFVSPRDPRILIPIYGSIDRMDQHESGGLIITDWKTGKFDYFLDEALQGNSQMLIYCAGIRRLYGVNPMVSYFVSVKIPRWDVDKYGARVLESERYRRQAKIRFDEQFPELLNEVDDVWAVLNFLAHPPLTAEEKRARDFWYPRSEIGVRTGIRRHVEQGRLIPNVGSQCGMCPERGQCRKDNPEDWQEYERRQRLGNVLDPLRDIPQEWLDPFDQPSEARFNKTKQNTPASAAGQLGLFEPKDLRQKSALRNHKLKAKEWKSFGFFVPKEWLALLRRMHELIPVDNGEVCPCKKTGRIPSFLLEQARNFFVERETYKILQEEEGKTRSGDGDNKVKDLFDSQVVRSLLKECPIEGCPFARKKSEEAKEESKEEM